MRLYQCTLELDPVPRGSGCRCAFDLSLAPAAQNLLLPLDSQLVLANRSCGVEQESDVGGQVDGQG